MSETHKKHPGLYKYGIKRLREIYEERRARKKFPRIECACGCKELMVPYKHSRGETRFKYGHHSRTKEHREASSIWFRKSLRRPGMRMKYSKQMRDTWKRKRAVMLAALYRSNLRLRHGTRTKWRYKAPNGKIIFMQSGWEVRLAKALEGKIFRDKLLWTYSYNPVGAGFYIKYRYEGKMHRYYPDFLRENLGGPELIEVKGYRTDRDLAKWKAAERQGFDVMVVGKAMLKTLEILSFWPGEPRKVF